MKNFIDDFIPQDIQSQLIEKLKGKSSEELHKIVNANIDSGLFLTELRNQQNLQLMARYIIEKPYYSERN
jgi:hypothetical protein